MQFDETKILLNFLIDILDRQNVQSQIATFYELDSLMTLPDKTTEYLLNHNKCATLEQLAIKRVKEKDLTDKKADRVFGCGKYWFNDWYKNNAVKHVKAINLCEDRFCPNCQKMKQISRLVRFTPELERIAEKYDLYHVVLTLKNCSQEELEMVLDKMRRAFKRLIEYLNLKVKNKALDFKQYGYVGALRSTEITFNIKKRNSGNEYHPHLHCIIALKKNLTFTGKHENKFSHSVSNGYRTFTDFEILLQRLWYLLLNDMKVNRETLNSEPEDSYSCIVDPVEENHFYEVFKYATKSYDDNDMFLDFDQFQTLKRVLHKKRTIQGYGEFYALNVDETIDDTDLAIMETIVEKLKSMEEPISTSNHIEDVFDQMIDGKVTVISGKRIHAMMQDEKQNLITALNQETYHKAMEMVKLRREENKLNRQERDRALLENYFNRAKTRAEKQIAHEQNEILNDYYAPKYRKRSTSADVDRDVF